MSYEDYTYDFLLNRALDRVSDSLDKREGSIIYDALAPACYELAEAYQEMILLLDRTFADTSTGDYLTRRAEERGLTRDSASQAIRKGEFNIAIPIGSRFSIQSLTYEVTELISGTDYQLQCEQYGTQGNGPSGAMLPIDYISGLTTSNLTDVLIPGDDEETDEQLRERYYDNLESQAFGGNQADYIEKTNSISGVGGTKVTPVWNGGGTVKLTIVDSSYDEPSTLLVDTVQTDIDPVVNGGEGVGLAPIGHVVTVEGVTSVTSNIGFTLTFDTGYTWVDLEATVTAAIETYLLGLRETWDDEDFLVVRLTGIESTVLGVVGVIDITGTTINTLTSNLILTESEIPVLGTVTNV